MLRAHRASLHFVTAFLCFGISVSAAGILNTRLYIGFAAKPSVRVTISPKSASLPVNQTQQFSAKVLPAKNSTVFWSVNGINGGNSSVGTISSSGLYTAPAAPPFPSTVAVTVTSIADPTQSDSASVTIETAPLVITTPNLPNGEVGVSYGAAITTSGGVPPAACSVGSGQLPPGLSIAANKISGTPAASGSYAFSIVAEDSVGQQTSQSYSVSITALVSIVTEGLPDGMVGVAYNALVEATGGALPYAWSVTAGQLPGGLALDTATGSIAGTPTAAGSFSFTVQIQDSLGQQASRSYSVSVAPGAATDTTSGGLVSYPVGSVGSNLLLNPGFEQADANGKPLDWSDNGFVLDTTVAHSGGNSFRITDANLIQYSQYGWQDVPLKKGIYDFSGWVKLDNIAATTGSGVRLCLSSSDGGGCTGIIKGTADWQQLSLTKIAISQDATVRFQLATYAEPDGTAWFDDVELRREEMPLDVFLLYPNYRGMLFDDQSQMVRFDVAVDPPSGTTFADYQVNGIVTDEGTGAVVLQTSFPATASNVAELDFWALALDNTYLVTFNLVKITGGAAVYSYPAYRISKMAGSLRGGMTLSFDEQNRFLVHGNPTFLLGAYDSGLGYTTVESGWEDMLTTQRRLFELPINLYLNYWYGEADNTAILPLMNVLQNHGMMFLQTANCFSTTPAGDQFWYFSAPDADIIQRSSHPAFAGVYTADECSGDLAPNVFDRAQRIKILDPDGITLGTLFGDAQLPLWRDTVDLLATDPYPLYGAEPPDGYRLSQVADWTRATQQAVQGSRPFATVIQFFKFTSLGRWPTQAELRNMSYMAIAEGANGLLYWSLGTNALAYVCSGWCDTKIDYFNRLKAVISELDGLQPALAGIDSPDLLVANDNPSIHTRVKYVNGTGYLIAYNYTNTTASATLTWNQPPSSVAVYAESRNLPVSSASFTDSFGPYEAHVYIITP